MENKNQGHRQHSHCGEDSTSTSTEECGTQKKVHSTRKIFPLPTISIEEISPLTDTSNLIHSSFEQEPVGGKVEERKKENLLGERREMAVVIKLEKNLSLDSIPSLDGESDSVSLDLKGAYNDFDSDSEENSLNSLENAGNFGRKQFASKARSLAASLRRPKLTWRSFRNVRSEEGRFEAVQAEELERRLKALAAAFSERTLRTKTKIQQPPTPSSEESESEEVKSGELSLLERLRQLASPGPSEFGDSSRRKSIISSKVKGTFWENVDYFYNFISCNYILDPQSYIYISWLILVSITFSYNAWVIPLRVVFPYQTENNVLLWFIFDCIADSIYLVDVFIFKPHVKFLQSGFWVKEPKETMRSYLRTMQFKVDLLAMLPADIVMHFVYENMPVLRIPRIFKVETFWELFRQLDSVLQHPHRARIFHTCLYMLYMIHMVACMYYALSTWEGIATTTWTFDGIGNAYVRCFYFATKTATSIGKNPKPENELEYMFMTFAWLSGVFVFAILIGQIRDIIATATKSQTEYRILTSATVSYLHRLGVPRRLQDRVKLWLSYTWEQQKTLDETRILNLLPKSMKAEIALNIHVETLGKVKLFQSCETAFLRDLVVKLRSIIILPGDFVCRKGEIGREMFIVKSGKIQVIGGQSGTQVLATLAEGSVFGEIALLGIGGMNKRTADVRAAGFVNLFVLSKWDLNDVIRDYPEAQEIMRRKAKKLMRENIKKARATPSPAGTPDDGISLAEESAIIIKNKEESPQLIHTMLKLFPASTKIGRYLRKGSRGDSVSNENLDECCFEDDELYTSLTSYPPSPFIPLSPGHISQKLDISIMTGASSERMLSPLDSQENSLELSISLSDEEERKSDGVEVDSAQNLVPADTDNRSISPYMRNEKIPPVTKSMSNPNPKAKPGKVDFEEYANRSPRKSCPQFEPFPGKNRDEIPIEFRPPLYIIEPGKGRSVRSGSSKSRILRRIVLQQDSSGEEEDEDSVRYREDDRESMRNEGSARATDTANKSEGATPSSRAALIATNSAFRRTLERQSEVDIDMPEQEYESNKAAPGDPQRESEYEADAEYSLDIESD